MTDEKVSIEELEAQVKEMLQKKHDALKAEADEKARIEAEKAEKEAKEAEYAAMKDRLVKELSLEPKKGLETEGSKKSETPSNKHVEFAKKYIDSRKISAPSYGSSEFLLGDKGKTFEFTDSDDGCDNDVSSWSPADVYADLIFKAMTCKGELAGKVTVRGIDFKQGGGGLVQIRTLSARSAQGPLAACECLSCVSSSFSTYTVTLDVYGDLVELCEKDIFEVGEVYRASILDSMSEAMAVQLDAEIWTQLSTATPGNSEVLGSAADCDASRGSDGECCTYACDLYDALIRLDANMRGAGYKPDFLILHPTVAAFFKFKDALHVPGYMAGQISVSEGKLIKIGSINVIEFCGATSCTDEGDEVMAILIDSSRAVAEAWGKRPHSEQDRNIDCDSTTYAIHMYVGIDELDTDAIGHILNPS